MKMTGGGGFSGKSDAKATQSLSEYALKISALVQAGASEVVGK
jgi:hypothetical protein